MIPEPVWRAVEEGKIPAGRAAAWAELYAADPQGTTAVLAEMVGGIVPSSCPRCGCGDVEDVRTADRVEPVRRICTGCGWSWEPRPPVVFRRWCGQPVHMPDLSWEPPPQAQFITDGGLPTWPRPAVTVWCGPPADRPYPPTPEDLLQAAGIDPGQVFA